MMRSNGGSVQIQDPSASPTFALSRAAPISAPDVPPTLRRNLFSSHLSRRPTNTSTDRVSDPFQSPGMVDQQKPDVSHTSPKYHSSIPNIYEPRRSPSRSQSPVKFQLQNTSTSSIVALDPKTGRPQLPKMPDIPDRMPEGSDDEEAQADDGIDGDYDANSDDDSLLDVHQKYSAYGASQMEPELPSSGGGMSMEGVRIYDMIDPAAPHIDLAKVRSMLTEMQSQQKAKAKAIAWPETSSIALAGTPSNSGVSARTRGKAKVGSRPQVEGFKPRDSVSKAALGGVGATMDPADKENLLSAIMAGLSKKIQEADENAWMFGDERTVLNGLSAPGGYSFGITDDNDANH